MNDFDGTNTSSQAGASTSEDDELLNTFLQELKEVIQNLETSLISLETAASDANILNQTFRSFHNLKGASASMGFDILKELAHYSESLLDLARSGKLNLQSHHIDLFLEAVSAIKTTLDQIAATKKQGSERYFDILHKLVVAEKEAKAGNATGTLAVANSETSGTGDPADKKNSDGDQIKVSRIVIEQMMLLVGEFMQLKNKIHWLKSRFKDPEYYDNCRELDHFSTKLQRNILKLRLSPVSPVFLAMRRVVRSTAQQVNKKINFEITGEDTLLDRSILDVLADPLMHILRNGIDHGIESGETRINLNKPEAGTIQLKAGYRSGEVHITVSDDGRGIDANRVKAKAVKLGLITEVQALALTTIEAQNLVFLPGFSGADQITETSGRGVGMDVVRERITSIGGLVEIHTELGSGSSFTLKLPLSLAIVECLGFKVGSQSYAIPQLNVEEVYSLSSPIVHDNIKCLESGYRMLVINDTATPILDLGTVLEQKDGSDAEALIKVRHGKHRFILEVGKIMGPMSIVSQPMPLTFSKHAPFSGITKQGDGSLLFQLDIVRLFKHIESVSTRTPRKSDHNRGTSGTDQENSLFTSSDVRRLQQKTIAFRNNLFFCLPVQRAKRIVYITSEEIKEISGSGRSFVTLEGKTIPLIWIEETLLRQTRIRKDAYSMLVIQNENEVYGLPMAEFKGIERMPEAYDTVIAEPGILGSTVIGQDTFLALDIPELVRKFHGKKPVGIEKVSEGEKRPLTVLCAEDDKFFMSELTSTLKAEGYNLIMCTDGLIAKTKLEDPKFSETIDLIVTDIEMPNLTGLGLCRWLKSTKHAAKIPVVAYTAITTNEMREKMMAAGAAAFVSKMCLDELATTLTSVLKGETETLESSQQTAEVRVGRIVTFQLNAQWYGLPMEHIKEVSPNTPAANVPGTEKWMESVTSFRGNMIPVLDLTKYIDVESRIGLLEQAVVEVDKYTFALRVAKIGEVVIRTDLTIGDGLPKITAAEAKFSDLISQVATYQDQIIFIFSPSKLSEFCSRTRVENTNIKEMVA